MIPAVQSESQTLIDELLDEQRLITAVARFSQKHEGVEIPLQSRYYRDLLPLVEPHPGEQYAFEVDLDKCSGCKACVAACHSLNGLEPGESWRSVGLLISEEPAAPLQQTVTTACHHCVDPACLNGCPVLAYEKDVKTGIVRHLDDQCIGCQYCVLKCPYEVPRYSSRLGIVRKCDMCTNRLSVGEAPACVQSCPNAAIRITVISQEVIREEHSTSSTENTFLAESPNPAYTIPATRYISTKGLPATVRAADSETVQKAPAHWPLVLMLVLTQAAVGAIWFQSASALQGKPTDSVLKFGSAALFFAGLGTSIFHLGRPLQAWRAFIGLRRSWLSREIVAFNALAAGVILHLTAGVLPFTFSHGYGLAVLVFCSLTGAAALLSSIMVYVDTPREFWRWKQTVPRFAGTTILLGLAVGTIGTHRSGLLFGAIAALAILKLALELTIFRHLEERSSNALQRTARLMAGELSRVVLFRVSTLVIAIALCAITIVMDAPPSTLIPALLFAVLLGSELAERYVFFSAVAQPKMPGGLV